MIRERESERVKKLWTFYIGTGGQNDTCIRLYSLFQEEFPTNRKKTDMSENGQYLEWCPATGQPLDRRRGGGGVKGKEAASDLTA